MFQTYDERGGPEQGRLALPLIRAELASLGLDGFIVPHEDEWQNEYLPDCAERLAWATGFTGSAGAAIVMMDKAAVFVDGRYTLQVGNQVDGDLFEIRDLVEGGPALYLREAVKAGSKVGYDPRLVAPDVLSRLETAASEARVVLVPTAPNPLDAAWADRPNEPTAEVVAHEDIYSGESSASKRSRLGEALARDGNVAAVITSPASLAWLFNIRGADVARTPLPLGAALLRADGTATLFMKPEKTSAALRGWLGNEVALDEPERFEAALRGFKDARVLVDPASSSAWVFEALKGGGAQIVRGSDPCILPRACKNAVELAGSTRAHERDGVALVRFLAWIDREAPKGTLTEIAACKALEQFRAETGGLRDLSFDTISGSGPNGAVVHYRVTEATDRVIAPNSLFLVDSGGQYLDGTTDVTRTIAIGTPSAEMADRFTRVLKGHIALSRVRFPKGTSGVQIDALARMALWDAGFDYDHGTGHGVGSFLGVHEGPHRISKNIHAQPLEPGMIVSNEPGYYKTGAYGIRIENLQYVNAPADIPGGERPMLSFTTLTLAPIDRRLILAELLSRAERDWLNEYHHDVYARLSPRLEADDRAWLAQATAEV